MPSLPKPIQHLMHNLRASLHMLAGSRTAFNWVRPAASQFFILMLLGTLGNILFGYIASGESSLFNSQGIINYLIWPFLGLIMGMVIANRTNMYSFILVPAVLWLASDTLVALLQSVFQLLMNIGVLPIWSYRIIPLFFLVLFIWQSVSLLWIFAKKFHWSLFEQALVLISAIVLMTIWQNSVQKQPIWQPKLTQPTISEALIYNQTQLLDDALANLKNGKDGKQQLYLLAIAGSATQPVFGYEAKQVRLYFDNKHITKNRSLLLTNTLDQADNAPIASQTAITKSLDTLAKIMGKEDVLLLTISSHGLPNQIELSHDPIMLDDITSSWLKNTLDKSGIQNRLIIISSCYSGSFVNPLKTPHSIIITASSANKPSFGCTNEADFTYFGRAFFVKGLPRAKSLHEAFATAKDYVAKLEQEKGFEPSEPQLYIGNSIENDLPALEAMLFAP